jgi:FkbM family methyltransferase
LKELLLTTGLYRTAQRLRASTVGREPARARERMRAFFATLLPNNVLVFDVGANAGAISEALASTGARVIAVEPNADLARDIQRISGSHRIQVIQAAVGGSNGLATLNVSDLRDFTSTLSNDWMAKMQESDQRYVGNWSRQAAVPLLTLDTLSAHFGEPYFIKIDVEGYEAEVLRGLSKQPPLLSFEFHKTYSRAGLDCLQMPVFHHDSSFNFVKNAAWGYPAQFEFDAWLSRQALIEALLNLSGADDQGDIYVRRPGLSGRAMAHIQHS